jgi:hypothetical protein
MPPAGAPGKRYLRKIDIKYRKIKMGKCGDGESKLQSKRVGAKDKRALPPFPLSFSPPLPYRNSFSK